MTTPCLRQVTRTGSIYTKAILKIGSGTIDLPGAVRIGLAGSASNAISADLSLKGSLTDEVTEQFGYSSSGKALASESWAISGSGAKFDVADPIWTATGGAINSIKFAYMMMSAAASANSHMLLRTSLTSTAFNLASGNTLTLQMATGGVFVASNG